MYFPATKKLILLPICLLFFQYVFSQPVIKSFSPESGPVGSTVNISGSGFSNVPANNIVYFGTVRATVVTASANSLQVIVPGGTSYEPMSVTTGGLTAYSEEPFDVTFPGAGSTFPPDIFNTRIDADIDFSSPDNGYGYYSYLTVVDLDNDGKPDMVSFNRYPKTISVVRNTSVVGKISFEAHKEYSTANGAGQGTHADFDGDGKQDIAVVCGNVVSIFRNNSTTGFIDLSRRVDINLTGNGYYYIAVNDIDRDGKPDFVVAGGNASSILLYRNTGTINNIAFDPPVAIPVSYGHNHVGLKDLDGDNLPELVVDYDGYPNVYYIQVAKNTTTGSNISFGTFVNYGTVHGPNDVDFADIDGDKKPDIITPNNQNYNFSVLENDFKNGSIGFKSNEDFYVGRFPQRLAIGDIDGDGKPDVAVSNNNNIGFTVSVYKNISAGNKIDFTPRKDIYGKASDDIAIADMDGDGIPEIEVAGTDYSLICVFTSCPQGKITQQPKDSLICISGNAAFSVVTTDTTAGYEWQVKNGEEWNYLEDNSTYSGVHNNILNITGIDTSMNGLLYRCVLLNKCKVTITDSALLTVKYPSPPAITIKVADTLICPSTKVVFTASSSDEGSKPVYEWRKNNIVVGADSKTYTDSTINEGDKIVCTILSDAACLSNNKGTSNTITMHVSAQVTPQLSVTASSYDICAGTTVVFTAATQNAGPSPQFQWIKNNVVTGTVSATYSDSHLNNNDTVYCILFPDLKCNAASMSSNRVAVTVQPLIQPAINITASKNNICPKEVAGFASVVSNAGNAPVYAWKKNGNDVGTNASFYSDSLFNDGDIISCILYSSATGCLVPDTAESNTVVMHLQPLPGPVNLGADRKICPGSNTTINTSLTYNTYLWQDNSTTANLTATKPGIYYVQVSDACGTISSDTISIMAYEQPASFLPHDTSLCSYDHMIISADQIFNGYLWSNNATTQSIDISAPGTYWLQVTDNNNCTARDSITISGKDCMYGVFVPSAFTPNGDGRNDVFKPLVFGSLEKYEFVIYNRFGQQVFRSTDPGKGWDGTLQGKLQTMNAFVWVCMYQMQGQLPTQKKGTVIVLK